MVVSHEQLINAFGMSRRHSRQPVINTKFFLDPHLEFSFVPETKRSAGIKILYTIDVAHWNGVAQRTAFCFWDERDFNFQGVDHENLGVNDQLTTDKDFSTFWGAYLKQCLSFL